MANFFKNFFKSSVDEKKRETLIVTKNRKSILIGEGNAFNRGASR